MARNIADRYLIPMDTTCLQRRISKTSQASIEDKQLRLENISGLFSLGAGADVSGRRVILIDDVSTTGATLNECAKVLKAGGAKEIFGLVIARG